MPQSPLMQLHEHAAASFLRYGTGTATADSAQPLVVETFGELEAEYAAIRKGCGIIDLPQRATIQVTGSDRLDFLNRMLTQELAGVQQGDLRRSFWLNRKGRIVGDLRLIQRENDLLIDTDILCAANVIESLEAFIFAEDISLTNTADKLHHLALHGPTALSLLASVADAPDSALADLQTDHALDVSISGHSLTMARDDEVGDISVHLFIERPAVETVYGALLEAGVDVASHQPGAHGKSHRLRPIGWHAYNIARIEGGTPLFNLDFGSDSLPAETGVLEDRVSFKKGCYLGQEVVARMQSLGHAKQSLVAFRVDDSRAPQSDAPQPVTGSPLILPDDDARTVVGGVTSSTRSPMLGDMGIGFAQVKWEHTEPDQLLIAQVDGADVPLKVQESLRFWARS